MCGIRLYILYHGARQSKERGHMHVAWGVFFSIQGGCK